MYLNIKGASAIGLVLALSACASSSSTTNNDPVSRSGLPFATDDSATLLAGLTPDQTLTILLRSIAIDQPDLTQTFLDELEITWTPNPLAAPDSGTGTLEIDGETLVFVDGIADIDALENISATLRQELLGAASVLLSIEYNDTDEPLNYNNYFGTLSKSYFVLGFETTAEDIAVLAETPGTTFYTGGFAGFGEFTFSGGFIETVNITGDVNLQVDFASGSVDGDVEIAEALTTVDGLNLIILGIGGGGDSISLGLDDGTLLEGNGFTADATVVGDCLGCVEGTSASSLDGVFYGIDAAEVSGTVDIDFTASDGATLVGVGGYVSSID